MFYNWGLCYNVKFKNKSNIFRVDETKNIIESNWKFVLGKKGYYTFV